MIRTSTDFLPMSEVIAITGECVIPSNEQKVILYDLLRDDLRPAARQAR